MQDIKKGSRPPGDRAGETNAPGSGAICGAGSVTIPTGVGVTRHADPCAQMPSPCARVGGEEPFADWKYADITQRLVSDPHAVDDRGFTLLHWVARFGDVAGARRLIDAGTDLDVVTHENDEGDGLITPLAVAAAFSQIEVARLLLESGADPNIRAQGGEPPLISVLGEGTELTALLLVHGARVDLATKSNVLPLHKACALGQLGAARLLLEHGASISAETNHGFTALQLAVTEAIVQSLLEAGADPNVESDVGPPIKLAARGEQMPMIYGGQDPVRPGKFDVVFLGNEHPGKEAAGKVRRLVEAGVDPGSVDEKGGTLLHNTPYAEVVSLLVSLGVDVNARNDRDSTPLHLACWRGEFDCAKALIDLGAEISPRDREDLTPLHLASVKRDHHLVAYLIAQGADQQARDFRGNRPSVLLDPRELV